MSGSNFKNIFINRNNGPKSLWWNLASLNSGPKSLWWSFITLMIFSITECQVLHLCPSNPFHKYWFWETFGLRVIPVTQQQKQQPTLGISVDLKIKRMNQLLNNYVLIGAPSLRRRLEKSDQVASDDLSVDSKFHPFLSLPSYLCLGTVRQGTAHNNHRSSALIVAQGHSESLLAFTSPHPYRTIVPDCGSNAWCIKLPKHKACRQKTASGSSLSSSRVIGIKRWPLECAATLLTGTKSILKLEIWSSWGQTVI